MAKKYLQQNVYEASLERVGFCLRSSRKSAFSLWGKDSGIILNLFLDYIRKHNIKKRLAYFSLIWLQYKATIDYIKNVNRE